MRAVHTIVTTQLTMAEITSRQLEERVGMVAFHPPKSIQTQHELLSAPDNMSAKDGTPKFNSWAVSLSDWKGELSLELQLQLEVLRQCARKEAISDEIATTTQSAKSNSITKAKASVGSKSSSDVSFTNLVSEDLPTDHRTEQFLLACVPIYLQQCSQLHHIFQRKPT